ncbi:MAG: alpha/beta fold hydrolase [Actinomycetota bacterium]
MEPDRRTAELPWGGVSYLEWRPEEPTRASTVLLLHGGGLDSAWLSWGGVGGELAAAGHRVIAPDHPGYGHSPKAPWTASQEHLLGYVDALVRALGVDRFALGGLSMGAGLALGHVLTHPSRVSSLMLLGAYGLSPLIVEGRWSTAAQLLSWAATRTGMLEAFSRGTAQHRALMERSLRPVLRNPEQRTPELIDAVMEEARRGSGIVAFGEFQRDQVGARRQTTDYSARLAAITTPTLFVHGERDTGVPAAIPRRAAASMPNARLLMVPEAGHWVQRDRPEIVVPAMLEFLDAVDRGDA